MKEHCGYINVPATGFFLPLFFFFLDASVEAACSGSVFFLSSFSSTTGASAAKINQVNIGNLSVHVSLQWHEIFRANAM